MRYHERARRFKAEHGRHYVANVDNCLAEAFREAETEHAATARRIGAESTDPRDQVIAARIAAAIEGGDD